MDADKKVDSFATQALSSARWLKRALEQRNLTTLKITAEIVKKQKKFLEKGIDFLEPLSLDLCHRSFIKKQPASSIDFYKLSPQILYP